MPGSGPLMEVIEIPAFKSGYAATPLMSCLFGDRDGERHRRTGTLALADASAVSWGCDTIVAWAGVRRSVFALHLALGLGDAMLSGLLYQVSGRPI